MSKYESEHDSHSIQNDAFVRNEKQKPREWVIKEAFIGAESGTRYPAHVTANLSYASYEDGMVHVIEYSAYDALKAELAEAKELMSEAAATIKSHMYGHGLADDLDAFLARTKDETK